MGEQGIGDVVRAEVSGHLSWIIRHVRFVGMRRGSGLRVTYIPDDDGRAGIGDVPFDTYT